MNEKVGRLVGEQIGIVEEVEGVPDGVVWGEFLRIRVKIDITQPLMRDTHVDLGPLGVFWVRFAYERLPNFCYGCGKVGHQYKDCVTMNNPNPVDANDKTMLPFGP